MHRRARGRCWRESNTNTPTSAPPARARGRKPNVYFAMCRAQKHVGGVGAREAATTKPQRETMREAGGRGNEVGVSRACDEKDFRDCVTGEGMGCERESDCVLGSPGRGGFGKWGYIEGPRTKAQIWWLGGVGRFVSRRSLGPFADGPDDGQIPRGDRRLTDLWQPPRAARLKSSRAAEFSTNARCRDAPIGAPGPLVRRPEQRRSSQPRPCRLSPVSRGRRPQAAKPLSLRGEWVTRILMS